MAITIDSKLEARLRERAEAEGLSVDAYIEHPDNVEHFEPELTPIRIAAE